MVQKLTGKNPKDKGPRHPEPFGARHSERSEESRDPSAAARPQDDRRRYGKTVIGLTGGFGSGKTTAAHFFEELGAFVLDSDMLAHEALMKGSPTYEKVLALFKGKDIAGPGGDLDRKKIAGLVFRDPARRKKLEAVIHPYVFERIAEEIGDAAEDIAVVEIPLLFETGFEMFCHHTVVVKTPDAVTAGRLKEKGFSAEEIAARREAQLSLEEKLKQADIIIDNSGTFQETRREVEKVWKKLHPVSKGAV